MGIDKSLELRMKPVKSLAMKFNLNMRRIKGAKSSVFEYQDQSGYYYLFIYLFYLPHNNYKKYI